MLFYNFYFLNILLVIWFSYFKLTKLTYHGYIKNGISKKYFIIFYIILYILNKDTRIFSLRRILETLYISKYAKMSYLQLIHGIIYYIILSNILILKYKYIYIILNIIQGISHYRVYILHKKEYSHYYSEIMIHFYYFLCQPNYLLFDLFYVISFVYISIQNRKYLLKKYP